MKTPLIHQRWFRYLLTLSILASLFGLWTKYITRRHLIEKELLLNQKKMEGFKLTALQNHMNPHFISNSLFTIQDLLDKDRRWRASEFTSHFAELVRHSMHMTTKERISLQEELEFLKKYTMLEKMRFDNEISSQFIVDKELQEQANHIFIPTLLVQPLIENVFKYANLSEINNAFVKVLFRKKEKHIECLVIDNGIAFEKTESVKSKHLKKSTGLKTIEQRLKLNAKQMDKNPDAEALLKITNKDDKNEKYKSVHLTIYYNVKHEPNSYYN